MRLLLGGLILLGLFALASVWQRNWTRAVRAERDKSMSTVPEAGAAEELEWGKIIIGRPSGVEAIDPPQPAPPSAAPRTAPNAAPKPNAAPSTTPHAAASPTPAREFQLVIAKGQTLSTICKSYYGSGRNELVEAVARYNKLRDAGSIREGQTLLLPPLESLGLKKP